MQARTVALPVPVPYNAGAETRLAWATKAPGDQIWYALDCAKFCADADDHIASFAAQASDEALILGTQRLDADVMAVRLSGGIAGHSYAVTFTAYLASGAALTRVVWLAVDIVSRPPGYYSAGTTIPAGPAGVAGPAGSLPTPSGAAIISALPPGSFVLARLAGDDLRWIGRDDLLAQLGMGAPSLGAVPLLLAGQTLTLNGATLTLGTA